MKKLHLILAIIVSALMISCEEVVDVGLETAQPRLVIDAYLKWYKGTPGNEQEIRLSMTSPFYQEDVPPVSGATVQVTNADGVVFEFAEDGNSGVYRCNSFVPQIEGEYFLTVIANGQTYTASETLKPAPEITGIVQSNDGGFSGDEIEVRAFFTDNGETDDYYLYKYKAPFHAIPFYEVFEDRFFNGNQIFALFSDEDLGSGDVLDIEVRGISARYFNYMNILLGIAGSNGGSPFSTPPATVRGNIVNVADQQDFALGFFAASEIDSVSYTVE